MPPMWHQKEALYIVWQALRMVFFANLESVTEYNQTEIYISYEESWIEQQANSEDITSCNNEEECYGLK